MITKIVTELINPRFKYPQGGEGTRILKTALSRLEKKTGGLSNQRIVDYVVCALYPFKDRGSAWKINQVLGSKSIDRFSMDKGRLYYENQWLHTMSLSRAELLGYLEDRSEHPLAKYVYMPAEEGTKQRLLNSDVGYAMCQLQTLGWAPESEACCLCKFTDKCKIETQNKYPELYRLRANGKGQD